MKMHELFAHENTWTKGMFHRYKDVSNIPYNPDEPCPDDSSDDRTTLFEHPEQFCHCILGAVVVCYPGSLRVQGEINNKLQKTFEENPKLQHDPLEPQRLVEWNDDPRTTIQQIRELVQLADV